MKSGIYMWTSPSGKSYIGQATDLNRRKKAFLRFDDNYSGDKINKARRKYNNIQYWTYKILEYCDIDALDERETYYINYYGTVENGYNCDSGGNENKTHSEETKRKMSEIKKGKYCGENHPMFGKHHNDETKRKLSESKKGANHPMWGKHHCEETRRKMSDTHKGKHHTEETRRKMNEALKGKYCGQNHPMFGKHHTEETKYKISEALKGENSPMWGKHLTEETKYKISESKKGKYCGANHPRAKSVLQYTKDGQLFIAEYSTAKEAQDHTGVNKSKICMVCKGQRKSAGGYIWKYKKEN